MDKIQSQRSLELNQYSGETRTGKDDWTDYADLQGH